MILIKKSAPPPGLDELKQEAERLGLSDKEGYDLLRNPLKKEVRNSLMKEQGHLCTYCMRCIPDERITEEDKDLSDIYIEHWQARSSELKDGKNRGLDYNNMLAVCSGNEKTPGLTGKHRKRYFTCDKKRDNRPLHINPLEIQGLSSLYYLSDGTIKSSEEEIDNDVNIILNLNCSADAVTLPQNRKAVLDAIEEEVYNMGDNLKQNCEELLAIYEDEEDPKTPYIGVGIWWLKKQIEGMQGQ